MKSKFISIFTLLLGLLSCTQALHAQDTVTVSNIKFLLLHKVNEAIVLPKEDGYTGSVKIPATVTHDYEPYKVTTIQTGAFKDCKGLKEIIIPSSVGRIAPNAFVNVPEGLYIYINKSGVIAYANKAFDESCFKNITLCLPTEKIIKAYKRSPYWSGFTKTGLVPKAKSDGVDRRTELEKTMDNKRFKTSKRSKKITY